MDSCIFCLLCVLGAYIICNLISRLLRVPSVGRYNDRYILVTGCDAGFGHEIAKRLDNLGCHVFAGCLTEKGETELKKTSTSQRLHTISLDVSSDKSVRAAFDYVKQHLPTGKGLWGVLNNAGVQLALGPPEWMTIDSYKATAAVNLYGLIDVTMTFLPLVKKECGRIVNTSSSAGRLTMPIALPYCVSKYGVEAFTDGLRRSLRPYKCKAILIEPSLHATNISTNESKRRAIERAWNQATPEVKKEFGEEFYHDTIKTVDDIGGTRAPPTPVIDAYQHALLGLFPRARYAVGFEANYFFIPIQMLPEWLGDWILNYFRQDKLIPEILKR